MLLPFRLGLRLGGPIARLRAPGLVAALVLVSPESGAAQALPDILVPESIRAVEEARTRSCLQALPPTVGSKTDEEYKRFEYVSSEAFDAWVVSCRDVVLLLNVVEEECERAWLCDQLIDIGNEIAPTPPIFIVGERYTYSLTVPVAGGCADFMSECDSPSIRPASLPIRVEATLADLAGAREDLDWVDFQPFQRTADGSVAPAGTATRARVGNVVMELSFGFNIQDRSQWSDEQKQEAQAMLDTNGLDFTHERFWAHPTVSLSTNIGVSSALGPRYSIWTMSDGEVLEVAGGSPEGEGLVGAADLISAPLRAALLEGHPLYVSVRAEGAPPAEDVWRVALSTNGQADQLRALLAYFEGALAADLERLTGGV